MAWAGLNELIIQQLDRKQQEKQTQVLQCYRWKQPYFLGRNNEAWVDLNSADIFGEPGGWQWVNKGLDFIWVSEKDGWRHIYKISRDGKTETLLTKGNYDIGEIKCVDETNNYIYFTASPKNATQSYLYRVNIEREISCRK